MTAGGYAMLVVSWRALVGLSVWCLASLLEAEGMSKDDAQGR